MITEAIILAGGVGTRLKSVVSDCPKALAAIRGEPFLAYLLAYLKQQGIKRFIFSLGYKHEMIEEYLSRHLQAYEYSTAVEAEPLGTGGGILQACLEAKTENVLICNGDTFFTVDVRELYDFHRTMKADCTLALKPMTSFERYGAVELNAESRIVLFREKQFTEAGLINGGVYLLKVPALLKEKLPEKFSFEKDYLEKKVSDKGAIFGAIQDGYFIDIGIPADYEAAGNAPELLNVLTKQA